MKEIVETDNKNRFSFNKGMTMIRANQGHSVMVNLDYMSQQPPNILYHGTASRFVISIREKGLEKRNRHHVHLSMDIETAKQVGARHGKTYIFRVLSGEMFENNYPFFLSENGVWLTHHVPIAYLESIESEE